MSRVFMQLVVLFFLVTVLAAAQTAQDLASKYPPLSAFEVRPGMLMTAKYAGNGQVCEIVLEKRNYQSIDQAHHSPVIPLNIVDRLINELAPIAERGVESQRLGDESYVAGGVYQLDRDFENVSISKYGSVRGGDQIVVIRWKKRTCASSKPNGTVGMQ